MRASRVGQPTGRGRRSRRTTWILSLTAVAAALIAVSAAGAARIPVPGGQVTLQGSPLGLGDHQTTVVVQLAGDPITVADANAAAPLSDSQKDSIRSQLRSQQAPVENQVRSYGGKVLASYQASYNGFKVSISASNAAQLASLPGVVAVWPLELVKPSNIHGIPLIGAPQVWDGLNGLHGEGIKIADIDTGIDYTHADFGGSGNPVDYTDALGTGQRAGESALVRPECPEGQGRHRPRRRQLPAGSRRCELPGHAATGSQPARLQRPRDAHRRHDGGLRRPRERHDVHGPVQRDDRLVAQLDRRPGRRAEGRPLRREGLRLQRPDERGHRRHRVGRRQQHGRHQHVARLAVRRRRLSRRGRRRERGAATASSSWPPPATRARART